MQFLNLRGHTRLIPQGGLAEFPDAILNAKRLDLYNLYREVRFLTTLWLVAANCLLEELQMGNCFILFFLHIKL